MGRMHFARRVTEATDTRSIFNTYSISPCYHGYSKSPPYRTFRALRVCILSDSLRLGTACILCDTIHCVSCLCGYEIIFYSSRFSAR